VNFGVGAILTHDKFIHALVELPRPVLHDPHCGRDARETSDRYRDGGYLEIEAM
jgi:hypothetical protein